MPFVPFLRRVIFMEYLVIYYDRYLPYIYWFDDRRQAQVFFRECKEFYSNVSLYSCKEVI